MGEKLIKYELRIAHVEETELTYYVELPEKSIPLQLRSNEVDGECIEYLVPVVVGNVQAQTSGEIEIVCKAAKPENHGP